MYWRSGQYEALRGRDRKERQRIVQAALSEHGRSTSRRLALVLLGLVAAGVALASRRSSLAALASWKVVALAVLGAALFYGYLLWEINGPIRVAVEKYLDRRKQSTASDRRRR